jgi:hypothetical protein
MNFRHTGIRSLVLCLALGALPIFSLSAQQPANPQPSTLGFAELPAPRSLHFPESSTHKATIGTISGDGDFFMSVLDWGSIKNMNSTFVLAGVDEYGLSIGYAQKAGKMYLGASYSGSLIDELFRRMTNQDVLTLRKEDTVTESSYITNLLDQDGKTPPGETISNNDVNLILGTGPFGLRLGFAEWIRAVEISSDEPYWAKEKTFESSLKPSLELGFNYNAGSVRVKPALRAAFDIHEYNSITGIQELYGTTTYWVVHEKLINFYEPSLGLSLGFDFANSDQASAELILDGDFAFRLYRSQDEPDPVRSTWYYGPASGVFPTIPINPLSPPSNMIDQNYDVTIPTDLRITSTPRFVYAGDISQRVTLGVKAEIGVGVDSLSIEQEDSAGTEYDASIRGLTITPDFSVGASFHLIPDHFSLHAGLGLMLFSYQEITTELEAGGAAIPKVTNKTMELPSARFAVGLTLNFTETVAMDLMAVTSGISVDATKFTLLLTVKN